MIEPLDLLAVGCHPDDVELTCGGTLRRVADQGYRTGILDLTRGELGTKGTPARRAREADRAAEILGATVRDNLELPDAGILPTDEARRHAVAAIRRLRPSVVILPWIRGRHPDHRLGSELMRDACFLAGLAKYGEGEPHRPRKVLYAVSFREDVGKPTFVVDVSEQFERKMDAIRCYASQFDEAIQAGEAFPTGQPFYELVETQGRHYGSLIRRPFGEPFVTEETIVVDDVVSLGVASF
ncbi:MAG TPA: bacillithiol biosynthesis deacetylase BshB1 [Gemmatimonadota bacterium]|nr:bacillithiol biosynthesis deacetylase BshB1 [Gemmatimonadota bacterium]